jgi:threonine dehydrogenase-like Zn-dependent dehydrogenase
MQALAVFAAQRQVKLIEAAEDGPLQPHQVRLEMLEVGVCGTDREICQFLYGMPPPGSGHLVLGHEALGRVLEVGAQVKGFKAGDLAVPMVRRPCPHPACPACRQGRQDFCFTGDYTESGIKQRHGYMRARAVEEERSLVPVPPELRGVAVLTEPLTIAEKALAEVACIQRRLPWGLPGTGLAAYRHRALVFGAGPVGLLGAFALLRAGYETAVYSLGPASAGKAAILKELGVPYFDSSQVAPERLPGLFGRIDLIFEATGAAAASVGLLPALGTNGVFVFTGVPGHREPVVAEAGPLMRDRVLKNQVVLGSVNAGRQDYEAAVAGLGAFMKRWPRALEALIGPRRPLKEFEAVLGEAAGGIKQVLVPGA